MTPLKSAIVAFILTPICIFACAFFANVHAPNAFQRSRQLGAGAFALSLIVAILVYKLVRILRGPASDD